MKIWKRINNSDKKKEKTGKYRFMISGFAITAIPTDFKTKKNKKMTVVKI